MAWIESHQELNGHPKVKRLARAMGWNLPETIGRLHMFWWWCVDYSPDGDLRKFNDADIAEAVALDAGQGQHFVTAMIECGGETASGFIERTPYFRVHDWWDFSGRYLQSRYSHSSEKWKKVKRMYGTRKAYDTQETHTYIHNQQNITEHNKPKEGARVKFSKPSARDVEDYGKEIGFSVNGQQFVDFYESKGWKVGTTPMRDWRAAVRTWKTRRQNENGNKNVRGNCFGGGAPTSGDAGDKFAGITTVVDAI